MAHFTLTENPRFSVSVSVELAGHVSRNKQQTKMKTVVRAKRKLE
jgi:hypothetical protein